MKKITAIIPCHNEEKAIGKVIESFPLQKIHDAGFELEILVIDNNSTDQTPQIAQAMGVHVIHEERKGKGNAIKTAFRNISPDTHYVIMLDGDNTYKPHEMLRLIEPLDSNFCDVIIGSRLQGKINEGSMRIVNRAGNWIYSFLVRYFYQVNVTDVLTGYFAWKKSVIDDLLPHLNAEGFAIEMEMITKLAKLEHDIYSVPITYDERIGHTHLNPFKDGLPILTMCVKNMWWTPPRRPDNSFKASPTVEL